MIRFVLEFEVGFLSLCYILYFSLCRITLAIPAVVKMVTAADLLLSAKPMYLTGVSAFVCFERDNDSPGSGKGSRRAVSPSIRCVLTTCFVQGAAFI